jgi:hypothetical protein
MLEHLAVGSDHRESKPKWISFKKEERAEGAKTDRWVVWSLQAALYLGEVKWKSSWRKYAFFPPPDRVFEEDCLRDIAKFCEEETIAHRKGRRAFRSPGTTECG